MAVFLIGLPGIYVQQLRADANYIVPFALTLRIYLIFLSLFLGWFHDAEILAPCLNKIGCGREKMGRRAPHLIYATIFLTTVGFFMYRPAKWADLLTTRASDAAILKYGNVSWIQYGSHDQIPYDVNAAIPKSGFDCSKKMKVGTSDGILHFNRTLPNPFGGAENPEALVYGNDICETFVSKFSVCWPGPSGAEDEGDGGKRVCAKIASDVLGIQFFIIGLFGYFFQETIWQAGTTASVEVYPWKEERVQLRAYAAPVYGFGWLIYLILFLFVASQHEIAGRPNGAIGYRNGIAIIVCCFMVFNFLSVGPFMDAKQVFGNDEKAINIFSEYKSLLTAESAIPIRYLWANTLLSSLASQIWLTSFWYLCYYVWGLSRAEAPGLVALGFLLAILLSTCFTCVWGQVIFGTKSKEGREHSRDPRKIVLISEVCSIIVGLIVWLTLYRPRPLADLKAGIVTDGSFLILAFCISPIFGSVLTMWEASAYGWANDYDNHYHADKGRKRRESYIRGISATCRGICTFIGLGIVNSLTLGANPVCNTQLSTRLQNDGCQGALYTMNITAFLVCRILRLFVIYFFPIHDDVLRELYKKQGKHHMARRDSKAWKTVNADKPVEMPTASSAPVVVVNSAPVIVQQPPIIVQQNAPIIVNKQEIANDVKPQQDD